ncbi:MAG: uroporphyrinogen decarboxylase family protein [Candidatus Humimicrobiaceae bacterium]
MKRKASEKINRIRDNIFYDKPDMVPIQDLFFWDEFIENWRRFFNLSKDTDISKYYDYDMVLAGSNIDPHIDNVKIIEKNEHGVIYEGGFGSILKLDFKQPIPLFLRYAVRNIKELQKFTFDDPSDVRRFNQPFAIPDCYNMQKPFNKQINDYKDDFCIFGNICEARETVWRVMGIENELMSLMDFPDEVKSFAEIAADFNIELGRNQLKNENINGLIIYGDVAYKNGLLMSPGLWREIYYPPLKRIVRELKKFEKPIIYHTDGNYLDIIEDFIEIGIDALHPNEAKAGIDVVKLREKYGKKIAYLCNIDVSRALLGSKEQIKNELTYKLKSAVGGGFLPGGDDISSDVPPENYDYYISMLKELR